MSQVPTLLDEACKAGLLAKSLPSTIVASLAARSHSVAVVPRAVVVGVVTTTCRHQAMLAGELSLQYILKDSACIQGWWWALWRFPRSEHC